MEITVNIFILMYIVLLLNICFYRHNILKFLMSLKLVFIIILTDFAFTSCFIDDSFGLIIALFLFLLAGSETALTFIKRLFVYILTIYLLGIYVVSNSNKKYKSICLYNVSCSNIRSGLLYGIHYIYR